VLTELLFVPISAYAVSRLTGHHRVAPRRSEFHEHAVIAAGKLRAVSRCPPSSLASARAAGRRAGAIIAATALAHDLSVWTQGADFAVLAELLPALRVHRG
jgi:predicted nucleic acid-binding protein